MTATNVQQALWKGGQGEAWVAAQSIIDGLLAPIEHWLADTVAADRPGAVLDIGCGTGATTRAIARRLGRHGSCSGVDISEPMLALARREAAEASLDVDFRSADAETGDLGDNAYDAIVSRFGVMFFGDPALAFANMRRAATGDARLRFIVWRGPDENPMMTAAERGAALVLPDLVMRAPDEPGPFGLAGRDRAMALLTQGGWTDVEIEPLDFACAMPGEELEPYYRRVGPLPRILEGADEAKHPAILAAVADAFAPFRDGDMVRVTAACWSISARAG